MKKFWVPPPTLADEAHPSQVSFLSRYHDGPREREEEKASIWLNWSTEKRRSSTKTFARSARIIAKMGKVKAALQGGKKRCDAFVWCPIMLLPYIRKISRLKVARFNRTRQTASSGQRRLVHKQTFPAVIQLLWCRDPYHFLTLFFALCHKYYDLLLCTTFWTLFFLTVLFVFLQKQEAFDVRYILRICILDVNGK